MSDYPKKIHECFKRTLMFESGKKIQPVSFCLATHLTTNGDTLCQGTTEIANVERFSFPNGSRCLTCPFLKSDEYISDALKTLRTLGLIYAQDNQIMASHRACYNDVCKELFLKPLVMKVRARCYLTFTDDDKRSVYNRICDLDFTQTFNLIDKMYTFTQENNIK